MALHEEPELWLHPASNRATPATGVHKAKLGIWSANSTGPQLV